MQHFAKTMQSAVERMKCWRRGKGWRCRGPGVLQQGLRVHTAADIENEVLHS